MALKDQILSSFGGEDQSMRQGNMEADQKGWSRSWSRKTFSTWFFLFFVVGFLCWFVQGFEGNRF